MNTDARVGQTLSIRDIGYCGLVAALVFIWPVVGTIALRHLLLGILLVLLLADGAVRARIGGVLRDLATPVSLLLLLTGWIVVHNLTLSQYPAYSHEEFRGQWLKPLLIFFVGVLLAARARHEPRLLPALIATIKWTLVLQVLVVLGDEFYLWARDIHLQAGIVRLTGTKTSMSYTALLLLSIMASGWLKDDADETRRVGTKRLLIDAAIVTITLGSMVLHGNRYGIVLSVGLLAVVATLIAWRQVRLGSPWRAMLLLALAILTTVTALYGAVKLDPRWERMAESAALALEPGHERDWRQFSDAHPPTFDDGSRVESSAFLRVARFRAGLGLIAERPLGWGFGRSAMEHVVVLRFQTARISSESGLVDWTLALGVPGIALWLGFLSWLLRLGWSVRHEGMSPAPLLLVIVVSIFLVRFVIDINTRDHMLEMFLFVSGLLGGAVAVASPPKVPR